jgi:folate-binding protein YgfZ
MVALPLHSWHQVRGGRFDLRNGNECVADYGNPQAEYAALTQSVGLLDLSFRGRICLTGSDRVRFLHGQVTNDIKSLRPGLGCYAALITAKGRIQSDLNIYSLEEELLLDFEPGLTAVVVERLERYIIADDVQVVDVAAAYMLLSLQGPLAAEVAAGLATGSAPPQKAFEFIKFGSTEAGERYLVNQPRLGTSGYDLFVPASELEALAASLEGVVKRAGGRVCGWGAFNLARIEQGIPLFGVDMDDTNLPLESGLETRAISYAKGCYIGQEVISRIRTYSEAARQLRRLKLLDDSPELPAKGAVLWSQGRQAGYITSVANSAQLGGTVALGYVRKENLHPDSELSLRIAGGEQRVRIVGPPFGSTTA